MDDLANLPLRQGIVSHYTQVGELLVHFLESRPSSELYPNDPNPNSNPPLIVLLHGFPELAFSWRKIMCPLAELGFRVVAPDLRGFGRTIPLSDDEGPYPYTYASPLKPFRFSNLARDIVGLVLGLGYESVACIMGHDSGSVTAASCAVVRPDMFKSVILMSAPFMGTLDVSSTVPVFGNLQEALVASRAEIRREKKHPGIMLDQLLASMQPPRMHYQHYFSLPLANKHMHEDLTHQQLHDFLRAYFHVKSAQWPPSDNNTHNPSFSNPGPLRNFSLEEVERIPPYYVMPRGKSMPENVERFVPHGGDLARSQLWLPDEELAVYSREYGRTGFQGGLNRYRVIQGLGREVDIDGSISVAEEEFMSELTLFARKKIEVPAMFVAGEKDWGPCQYPGGLEAMRNACPHMEEKDIVFVRDAGHWVQQENPEELVEVLKEFLERNSRT